MGAARQTWIGRFGFLLTSSLVALSLASEKAAPRTPRQTSGEEAEGSRTPGVWGPWGSWSSCSQPCGLGVLERTRSCRSPYQRDPWAARTDGAPLPAGSPPQRSGFGERPSRPPSRRWPAFPLRSADGNAWPVYGGNRQASTNRQVRQETLPASHSGPPRDTDPFVEAVRSWGGPLGREGLPGHPRPQRPATAGGSGTPFGQKVIPLYKPTGQGGPNEEEAPPRSGWPGWDASPIPLDSQAAWRSRVRESIKPGKYGYGRVPFALPLHKELAEEGGPRYKRHHAENTGETSPASSSAPPLLAAEKEWPQSGPTGDEKPPDRIQPGEEQSEGLTGAEAPRTDVGLKSRASGVAPSSPPSLPAEEAPRGSIPDGTQEDSAGGSSVAEEGASSAAAGEGPPHGQKDPHKPKTPASAPRDKGPRRQPNPRGPQPSPDPHLPPIRARSRSQRQHQPRGSGRGSRISHPLFVDRPGLRGPSEANVWLLHRGSPLPLHPGGQRPQAEPPQWNLYSPGTETFQCEGESRQFRSCRQQPCPSDRPDPRVVQCAAYNGQEFMGRFYQWEPFTEVWGSQRCELNCRPLGYRFYVRHTAKVQDGTPCEASSQDICVAGRCLTPGCDGILGSNLTLDKCGVCGGGDTACKLVLGNYSETDVPIGYHRILQIPAGATQIRVRELSRSPNYLALRTHNGKSIINGNWAVNPPGHYEAAGTVFVYTDQEDGELLTADGPTTKPVELYMIFQQDNPGVSYQFLLAQPQDSHRNARGPPEELGASAVVEPPAARPRQPPPAARRSPVSAKLSPSSGSWGSPRDPPPPPAPASQSRRSLETLQRSARVPPLPPPPPPARHPSEPGQEFAWRRFGNTECSASCGKGFWQPVYRCVSRVSQEEVGEEKCHQTPRPFVQEEICNTDPCPAFWDAGEWSACSRSCGPGTQHRQVLCRQIYANRTTMVHPQRCGHLQKPDATQDCQVHFCSHWQAESNWSSCSVPCGSGHRTRHVRCVSNHGELLRDTDCPGNHRPQSSEQCNMGPCVRSWFYSDWSNACSSDCGTGVQRRSVICLSSNTNGQADEDCATPKPADMRACDGGPCRPVTRWYKGPWSSCSSECGHGTQRRDVICVSKQETQFSVAEPAECAHLEKPPPLQSCTGTDCEARWFSTAWSTCSRSCLGGVQVREAQCLTQNKTLTAQCPLHLKPATQRPCNSQPCRPSLDVTCQDKYPNCAVIVQARLCVYLYYKAACCVSCSHAPERRHADGPSR